MAQATAPILDFTAQFREPVLKHLLLSQHFSLEFRKFGERVMKGSRPKAALSVGK